METIHTDSAYRALSGRESNRAKIKISPDQLTSLQEQRTLASSNVQQQMNDSDTKVTSVLFFLKNNVSYQQLFLLLIWVMNRWYLWINRVLVLLHLWWLGFMTRWRILKMLTPWSTTGWLCCFRCWHCQLGYHNEGESQIPFFVYVFSLSEMFRVCAYWK